MVVVPSTRRVLRCNRPIGIVYRRGISTETDAAVTIRDIRYRRHNGLQHASPRRELIDIRSVLVGDPKCTTTAESKAFGVNSDAFPAGAWAAETIACESGGGQDGISRVLHAADGIGIEASGGLTVGPSEKDGVEICELDVGWGGVSDRGSGVGDQGNGDLLNAILVVGRALCVPSERDQRKAFFMPFCHWEWDVWTVLPASIGDGI